MLYLVDVSSVTLDGFKALSLSRRPLSSAICHNTERKRLSRYSSGKIAMQVLSVISDLDGVLSREITGDTRSS